MLSALFLTARALIGANGLLVALLIGGGVLLFTYDQSRVSHGRALERHDTELRNEKAVNLANRSGAASRAAKRGMLDPYARAD